MSYLSLGINWKWLKEQGILFAPIRLSAVLTNNRVYNSLILSYAANISQQVQPAIIYYSQSDLFAALQMWQGNASSVF